MRAGPRPCTFCWFVHVDLCKGKDRVRSQWRKRSAILSDTSGHLMFAKSGFAEAVVLVPMPEAKEKRRCCLKWRIVTRIPWPTKSSGPTEGKTSPLRSRSCETYAQVAFRVTIMVTSNHASYSSGNGAVCVQSATVSVVATTACGTAARAEIHNRDSRFGQRSARGERVRTPRT